MCLIVATSTKLNVPIVADGKRPATATTMSEEQCVTNNPQSGMNQEQNYASKRYLSFRTYYSAAVG